MSLVRHVIRQLLDRVRTDRLAVGDPLPGEGSLAESLGVSRTVMREATAALGLLGVLDVGNGRRPRVGPIGPFPMQVAIEHALATGQVDFGQVWEVRRRLEAGAAASAARHRDLEGAVRLSVLARAMGDALDEPAELARLDIEFHREIARASANVLFEQIILAFAPLLSTAVPLAWSTRTTPHSRRTMVELHAAIADAVSARDPDRAEAAMRRHFDHSIVVSLASRIGDPL